jgi:hypothetical protein
MRSLTILLALVAVGCGAPSVDVPAGNDKITSDNPDPAADVPAPSVQAPPARYPYPRIALRGFAPNATRVFVEGAGNPIAATVQPVDGSFCIVVDLNVTPARYTLDVKSQAGDGRLSTAATVELDRAGDAPAPVDAKLCDGTLAGK